MFCLNQATLYFNVIPVRPTFPCLDETWKGAELSENILD